MIVTLTNGVTVANFSSPHAFTFTDGSVLGACPPEMSKALELETVEKETPGIKGTTDISLQFKATQAVLSRLHDLEQDETVDIILVPLPVMSALKADGFGIGKARVQRSADRITKAVHTDKWCI